MTQKWAPGLLAILLTATTAGACSGTPSDGAPERTFRPLEPYVLVRNTEKPSGEAASQGIFGSVLADSAECGAPAATCDLPQFAIAASIEVLDATGMRVATFQTRAYGKGTFVLGVDPGSYDLVLHPEDESVRGAGDCPRSKHIVVPRGGWLAVQFMCVY